MRTVILIAPLLALLMLSTGCGAFDFELEEVTDEVVLKGDLTAFRAQTPVPSDLIAAQQFSHDLEDEPAAITVVRVSIELTDTIPGARNMAIPFSFIRKLEMFVRSTAPGSTLPEVRIASIGVPPAGDSVDMAVDAGVDLLPYVREGFEVRPVLNGIVPAADLAFVTRVILGVDVF